MNNLLNFFSFTETPLPRNTEQVTETPLLKEEILFSTFSGSNSNQSSQQTLKNRKVKIQNEKKINTVKKEVKIKKNKEKISATQPPLKITKNSFDVLNYLKKMLSYLENPSLDKPIDLNLDQIQQFFFDLTFPAYPILLDLCIKKSANENIEFIYDYLYLLEKTPNLDDKHIDLEKIIKKYFTEPSSNKTLNILNSAHIGTLFLTYAYDFFKFKQDLDKIFQEIIKLIWRNVILDAMQDQKILQSIIYQAEKEKNLLEKL